LKKFLFLIVLSASISSAFAQTAFRKKVIHKTLNVLVEEYDTKDSASTFKTGYYARYNTKYGTPSKVGNYADNQRTGVWTFYTDSSKTYFKYNYSTGLILFAKPDTLAKYFLKQAEVDTTFYKDLTQVPMFVGGAVEFKDFITANLRYPSIAKENEITGKVIASFYIGTNGYIEMPKIIKGLGYGCDDEALRIIKLMPRWVPGRKQSEVRQLYYMTFNFGPKK
jgi:TonB family protein